MPWRCPACETPIRHSESEERPRLGVLYRCHLCRIELVFDVRTNKLTATGSPESESNDGSTES
jgi:hypothetical protein